MTDTTELLINVGGSALKADLRNLQPWKPLLESADSISVWRNGRERIRVDLDGLKRWIAFSKDIAGSPFVCIGYQETVGAMCIDGAYIGGSNRKVLAWLGPDNSVHWTGRPGGVF